MNRFEHDGISFHYVETGHGMPFVFQHGLGGDVSQPFGLFTPPDGIRMLAFDCRGHGRTRPLGDEEKVGIAAFADDLAAFLDHVGEDEVVVGGISMGAAVTLNFALRFADRLKGLVQSRPAWLAEPNRDNARRFSLITRFIRECGPVEGKQRFRDTDEYRNTEKESPDAANSLLGQFDYVHAEETAVKLERIPNDRPCASLDELRTIRVPTLVLANRQDPVHPFAFAKTIVSYIPDCEFHELTPKSVSVDQHAEDVQKFLGNFLTRRFIR